MSTERLNPTSCTEGLQGGESGDFYQAFFAWYFNEQSESGGKCYGAGVGLEAGFYAGKFTCNTFILPPSEQEPGPQNQIPPYVYF
jgi:hypothetical protein